ncbi:MAG: ROK family protein [Clostridia bacterium]|nr:ROK family protein [Clostridia bacterium]
MKYLIGVDGGGTKTELVVCDENGTVVARAVGGSSNPNDIGKEQMTAVIENLMKLALPDDCESAKIGLGISGIFFAGCEDYLRERLQADFPVLETVAVYSDRDSSLNCAYDGDGCIVIIGTGNSAFVRKGERVDAVGGGGYLIDSGLSGFDLGREVLNAVLSASDGREETTALTALFERETQESINAHIKTVYQKGKAHIASFARLAFEALELGDAVAERIFVRCVREFEKSLVAVSRKFGKERCEITLFGGLSKRFSVIERFLSKEIKEKIRFVFPRYPIVYGVIKGFLQENQASFAEKLKASYEKIVAQ